MKETEEQQEETWTCTLTRNFKHIQNSFPPVSEDATMIFPSDEESYEGAEESLGVLYRDDDADQAWHDYKSAQLDHDNEASSADPHVRPTGKPLLLPSDKEDIYLWNVPKPKDNHTSLHMQNHRLRFKQYKQAQKRRLQLYGPRSDEPSHPEEEAHGDPALITAFQAQLAS